jgi:hypothetical protein
MHTRASTYIAKIHACLYVCMCLSLCIFVSICKHARTCTGHTVDDACTCPSVCARVCIMRILVGRIYA